jgi:hypothetical protein
VSANSAVNFVLEHYYLHGALTRAPLERLLGKEMMGALSRIRWSRQISHAFARREKTL